MLHYEDGPRKYELSDTRIIAIYIASRFLIDHTHRIVYS
jgi:hypothetical protein